MLQMGVGMTRANRLRGTGGVFHLTHRCHNRAFLLKFACDRDAYRDLVREHLRQFKVWLLDYTLTSNHVHLLVDAEERSEISGFMREVASEFARAYNRRKGRSNAYWGDNFHATIVERGQYLWRCLCYIELNMVRCGVVSHPREWEWVGYHEIMGARTRYRVVDLDRLCWRLGVEDLEELRRNLTVSLAERIAREEVKREPCWTESLAVGSVGFLEKVQGQILSRRETAILQTTDSPVWVLHEPQTPYRQKTAPRNAASASK